MTKRPTVLVFGASNSNQSINRRLANHAAAVLNQDMGAAIEAESLDLNAYEMPIYSVDREKTDGIPKLAQDFYDKISGADGLIISFAEHNGSYTTAFKNVFDWCSRIQMKVYQDKPMLVMATSKGGRGGQGVLADVLQAFPHFGANITSSFSFGPFTEHFDTEIDALKTPELVSELRDALVAFQAALPKAS